MNEGKKFEQDIKNSVPEDVWYYRFKDGTANYEGTKNENTRFQATNICDLELYKKPQLYLFEAKSYTGKSISHEAFLLNQNKKKPKTLEERLKKVYEMVDAQQHGIVSGYIINLRDIDKTYYLDADKVLNHILTADRRSIPLSYMLEHGISLCQEKKRTRWRYDIKNLFYQIEVREVNK